MSVSLSQVRSDLSSDARKKVNTLVITDVHARDIITSFVRDSIMDAREFAWESQLRFYWDRNEVSLMLCSQGHTRHDWPLPTHARYIYPIASCL